MGDGGLPGRWPQTTKHIHQPRGSPAFCAIISKATMVIGVNSLALMTTALQVATAGAICRPAVKIGAFHGVIWNTTRKGSCRV